jgi:hypothetical protein
MNQFLTAILAFLYLGSSAGANVDMHYCMGKLADWSLTHKKTNACPKCGMPKNIGKGKGCCKDEQKFFKDNTAQKITERSLQSFIDPGVELKTSYLVIPDITLVPVITTRPVSHGPPLHAGIPNHIFYCSFLI